MTDKALLADRIFGYAMTGLGHDVSFTVSTAGGVWSWTMDGGVDSSLDFDDCPVTVKRVADGIFLVGRPDFDPADTVVLLFDFNASRVFVSGKDDRGDHAFMEGTITRFEALPD